MTLPANVQTLLQTSFSQIAPAQLSQLETLVGDSMTLTNQLQSFAAGNGTITFSVGPTAGSYSNVTNRITLSIPSLTASTQTVDNPFVNYGEPATGSYNTVVGQIIGALSHELGHYENAVGPLYSMAVANPSFTTPPTAVNQAQLTADKLLSEGEAIYNNLRVAYDIAHATNGGQQIQFTSGLPTTSANLTFEKSLIPDTVAAAVTAAADQVALTRPAGLNGQTYLQSYWNGFAPSGGGGLQDDMANVSSVLINTAVNGTATGMTLHHNDGSPKGYDSYISSPQSNVTTDQIVNRNTNAYLLEIVNPQGFTGTIAGLVPGSSIDLIGTKATSATLVGGNVVTVKLSTGGTFNLRLVPTENHAGQTFAVSSDGHGGTILRITTAAATGKLVSNTGTVTIAAGQQVVGTDYGIWVPNVAATILNAGIVIGTDVVGVEVGADASITNSWLIEGASAILVSLVGAIVNTGWIDGTDGVAIALDDGGSVTNAAGASIDGTVGGVVITGATGDVSNNGMIAASTGEAAELSDGGTVDNAAGATIDGGTYGVWMPDGAGTVTNQGSIIGTNDYGIEIGQGATLTNDLLIQGANGIYVGGTGTLTNYGLITATNGTAVFFGDGGSVTNAAGKTIKGTVGGVVMTTAIGKITNNGTILATTGEAVELSAGGTVSNMAGAMIEGGTYGVWMPDGPGTVTNQGSIIGTNDYGIEIGESATLTNDLLVQGANGIYVGGTGTLTNDGSVSATNGTAVFFGNGGNVTNAAGKTIKGTVGGAVMTTLVGHVTNNGTITATTGEAVELSAGGTVSNTTGASIDGGTYGVWMPDGPGTVTNQGTIIGTNDYGVEIGQGATLTNDLLVQGANGIYVGGAGTLTNDGSITATNGTAVFFGDGGSVANVAGKSIKGTVGGVVTTTAIGHLANNGTITATTGEAVELSAGGTVSNTTGASIDGGTYGVWMPDGPGTVTNQGTIIGTNDYGIEIGQNATLTNDLLVQGANGIYVGGAGTLTNDGSVTATNGTAVFFGDGGTVTNDTGKSIKGTVGGLVMTTLVGHVTNNGTITATTGEAVELSAGGTVSNTTGASIDGGTYGVWMPDGPGTVTNQGTIIGTNDYGIEISGNGANVINNGTIQGATGVAFTGTGGTLTTSGKIIGTDGVAVSLGTGNTLVMEGGASFVGSVLDPAASDTLELGTKGAGTLTGLGTTIEGFGSIVVDAGAAWTLPGTSTAETMRNDGIVTVAGGGRLDVTTLDLASKGVFVLDHGATLEVGSALSATASFSFLGADTLVIDDAAKFGTAVGTTAYAGPLLEGFATGDSIDLKDLMPTRIQIKPVTAGGLLDVSSHGMTASLLFQSPDLAGLSFHVGSDGHGGTLLSV
jgi:hypothetical protein